MSTALDVDIDPGLLKELEGLSDSVKCAFVDCEEEAVSILRCPCFEGNETMCGPHTAHVRKIQVEQPNEVVVFNETCKHMVRFSDCVIVAI